MSESDEYRCHSCHNKTFKDFYLLLNHFQDESKTRKLILIKLNLLCSDHIDDDDKTVGLLCWKKGCNQYFNSLTILEKHFREIHSTINSNSNEIEIKDSRLETKSNLLSKSRERLISFGEDLVLHYLENLTNEENSNEFVCDLCFKKFSSLSTLKVHYEDIHLIVLSSRAIQHWIFLLQKLHSSSSNSNKLKRQSSSNNQDSNQIKKSRSENLFSPSSSSSNHFIQYDSNKRQRTRITDEQLQILRAHFNINNSPSDEQILLMSQKSKLSNKVIKHWFRNTLFKERQRNKDSPYNFSNPPSTLNKFDLEEYQKTGTIIKKDIQNSDYSDNDLSSNDEQDLLSDDDINDFNQINMNNKQTSASRRANRTRFSDQQLRLLQDAFEANPYPKDDDLEVLSQKLKLNSRVIVVWFQNARQKARKSYENNQNDSPNIQPQQQFIKQEKDEGYSCKNCHKLFTRFAELMKHAKQCSPSSTQNSNKKNSIQKKDLIKSEPIESSCTSMDPLSSYQMLVAAASLAANQQQSFIPPSFNRKENFCDQCDKTFSSTNEFNEHQTLHMQALINAAAFFPLAAYHPAAAAAAAAMAAFSSQLFNNTQTPVNFILTKILIK
jgi:hypothetical protein